MLDVKPMYELLGCVLEQEVLPFIVRRTFVCMLQGFLHLVSLILLSISFLSNAPACDWLHPTQDSMKVIHLAVALRTFL